MAELAPYHKWLKTHPGGSLDDYFTDVQGLTPYDKGTRLEPRVWLEEHRESPDDFGKVDFNDEEDYTVATLHIELLPDSEGYVLKGYANEPLRVEIADQSMDGQPLTITPTEALQEQVREVIAGLRTPYEQGECVVFWEWKQAVIIVPGEKHVRKQQIIMVHEGSEPSSAIVKSWADGDRDTRID